MGDLEWPKYPFIQLIETNEAIFCLDSTVHFVITILALLPPVSHLASLRLWPHGPAGLRKPSAGFVRWRILVTLAKSEIAIESSGGPVVEEPGRLWHHTSSHPAR